MLIRIVFFISLLMVSVTCSFAEEAVKNLTREEQSVLYQAQEALNKKAYNKAQSLLDAYIKKNPETKNSLAWYALGNALYMSGNIEKAFNAYEKGFKFNPKSFNLCINLAKTACDLDRFSKAGQLLEKAYTLSTKKDRELLLQAGTAFYKANDFPKARDVLKKAVSGQKQINTDWLRLYIHVCLELKEWKDAENTLEIFLKKHPENVQYWKLLAQIRLNRNNYNDAAAALEIAYGMEMPRPKELEELANLYFLMNLPLKAARTLEKAWGRKPGPKQCEKISKAFAMAQRKEQAINYMNLAIKQNPCAALYYEKGKLCYEWGLWKKAVLSFKNCIKLNPEQHMASLLLGYCALEIEDFDLAAKSFLNASKKEKYKKEALAALELCKIQ